MSVQEGLLNILKLYLKFQMKNMVLNFAHCTLQFCSIFLKLQLFIIIVDSIDIITKNAL